MGIVFANCFLVLGITLATAADGESQHWCCTQAVSRLAGPIRIDNLRLVAFLDDDHQPLCRHHTR